MSDHYFSPAPTVRSKPATVELALPDLTLTLGTDRGTFSPDRIDPGTHYLLQAAPLPPADARHLADVGCGYGPIACTLARRAPDATVWAVDVNERATALCRANATDLGLANVRTLLDQADRPAATLPDDVVLDAIYANPPIRIGKPALHALLQAWLARLGPGRHAWLVVQKHLGADSLQAWLERSGHPTRRLSSRAGYRILEVAA